MHKRALLSFSTLEALRPDEVGHRYIDAVLGRPYCKPSCKLRIKYRVQDVMICIMVGCASIDRTKACAVSYPTEIP